MRGQDGAGSEDDRIMYNKKTLEVKFLNLRSGRCLCEQIEDSLRTKFKCLNVIFPLVAVCNVSWELHANWVKA